MINLANNLGYYLGQYIIVKTTGDDVLMLKILRKRKKLNGYDVTILTKNGKKAKIDSFIYKDEIKMICVIPSEVQQDLDLHYKPLLIENIKDKNLPSEVHFGKRSDDE